MKPSIKAVTRGKNQEKRELAIVKLDEIVSDPHQPRKFFHEEDLKYLAETIRKRGVLQPIIVRRGEDGKIYPVIGERRVRAARKAGKEKIPALFMSPNSRLNPLELSLIENLHRKGLKPLEEAEALHRLKEEHNYRDEDLGRILGKSRVTVTELISLNRLPEEVKDLCRSSNISKSALIRIARMDGTKFDKYEEVLKLRRRHPRPKTEIAKDRAASLLKLLEPFKEEGFEGYRKEYRLEKDQVEELVAELSQLKSLIENILNSQN